MQTTIRMEDGLFRKAKSHAASLGCSLNDFIADAVRAALVARRTTHTRAIPTFKGQGVQPGINLDDTSSLLDAMDESFGYMPAQPARKVAAEPSTERP